MMFEKKIKKKTKKKGKKKKEKFFSKILKLRSKQRHKCVKKKVSTQGAAPFLLYLGFYIKNGEFFKKSKNSA
jgi:hypothetical protein